MYWLKMIPLYYFTVVWVRSRGRLTWVLCSEPHKAELKPSTRLCSYLEALGEKPFSKFIQVVGRTEFLESVVLKSLFPYWLSAGGCSFLLEVIHIPSHGAPSISKAVKVCWDDFMLASFWLLLLFLYPKKILTFKGLDWAHPAKTFLHVYIYHRCDISTRSKVPPTPKGNRIVQRQGSLQVMLRICGTTAPLGNMQGIKLCVTLADLRMCVIW